MTIIVVSNHVNAIQHEKKCTPDVWFLNNIKGGHTYQPSIKNRTKFIENDNALAIKNRFYYCLADT
jgi:hypothetical protein